MSILSYLGHDLLYLLVNEVNTKEMMLLLVVFAYLVPYISCRGNSTDIYNYGLCIQYTAMQVCVLFTRLVLSSSFPSLFYISLSGLLSLKKVSSFGCNFYTYGLKEKFLQYEPSNTSQSLVDRNYLSKIEFQIGISYEKICKISSFPYISKKMLSYECI